MLRSCLFSLCAFAFLVSGMEKDPVDGPRPTPIMRTVLPEEAKAGDTLSITGENLDKAHVADVYLTTGQDNFKLQLVTQEGTKITAKVPATVKSGRLRLMVLTAGVEPVFLEQPIMVEIQ